MRELYIGLMSGTSLDGIDASLIEIIDNKIRCLAFEYNAFSKPFKDQLRQLSAPHAEIKIATYGFLHHQLGELFADTVHCLLNTAGIDSSDITAIGSHGLTICHSPDGQHPFSLQIGDPNIISEKTGITTIADFRGRDIAAGGQGAPLVPAFHNALFSHQLELKKQPLCIVNIGGIANITYLSAKTTTGFDTGPGNVFIDYWINRHLHRDYDQNGKWARSGKTNQKLLEILQRDKYFKSKPPKSTGKEYFSPAWLEAKLKHIPKISAVDVQTTLTQLTANTISDAIMTYAPQTQQTLICGGGVHNSYLIDLLGKHLPGSVDSTASVNINPDHIEAMAFAWIARQTVHHLSGNLPAVTGASNPVVLGGIYPGKYRLN